VPLFVAVGLLGILASVQTVVLPALGGKGPARFVALLVYAFVFPNIALSYFAATVMGPSGPILASIFFTVLLLGALYTKIRRSPEALVSTTVSVSA